MSADFRALCAELLDELEYQTDWSTAESLKAKASAALADEPAVPQDREPASVTGQLSDEELLNLAQQYSVVYLLSDGSACHPFQEGYDMRNDVLNFARAVLARWGNPAPQPPADGEVAELVEWLRVSAAGNDRIGATTAAAQLNRAAELIQRQTMPEVNE